MKYPIAKGKPFFGECGNRGYRNNLPYPDGLHVFSNIEEM